MLSKNKKRLKLKNPKCPQCGSLLKIHDYYGPKKAVRYACPNQNCELKTISENTLLKKQFYKCKYELIYNVLIRLIDEKKLLKKTILSKGMIDQGIVEECIKELLRHSNKHCLFQINVSHSIIRFCRKCSAFIFCRRRHKTTICFWCFRVRVIGILRL